MDRGAWWVTVHGVAKSLDMTERAWMLMVDAVGLKTFVI